ncbi:MAG: hypothetical protein H0V66_08830 [Bdellovibrionales bacterium]|nr:hypothetical protein [Bdellovibrionales bacterium]
MLVLHMAKAHYFYLLASLSEVERIVVAHQQDFDDLINDTLTETEMTPFERILDSIAAIYVQPISNEITFDDFHSGESQALRQRSFFDECKSSICLDHLPEFDSNPFQVTYLIELLRNFEEVLIDTGGVNELVFKKEYLEELKKNKNIFSLIPQTEVKPIVVRTNKPIDPIDFLIQDVYRELDRLIGLNKLDLVLELLETQPEKTKKTFIALKDEKLDASTLLRKSGLIAKDFDDNLERLKFFLRKIA